MNIINQIEKLPDDKNKTSNAQYDPISLYHDHHITDGRHKTWSDILDATLLRRIEKKHASWLKTHGYFD